MADIKSAKSYFAENGFWLAVWAFMTAVLVFGIFPQCSAEYINYDSAYQFFLTQHSMSEILEYLPKDYSPPFYAVALKLYSGIFGNNLFVMRTFGLLAVIGMLYISVFPVRRLINGKTAVLCGAMILFSYVNLYLVPEIRPTIYADFFCMGMAIYAYAAFKEQKKYGYILTTIFAILSMYTHNVAMLTALGIYITMLAAAIIKKDKKRFVCFFISGAVCAITYIPWLFVVVKQYKNVIHHFWKSTNFDLPTVLYWTFGYPFNDSNGGVIFSIICLFIAVVISVKLCLNVKWKTLNTAKKFSEAIYTDKIKKILPQIKSILFLLAEVLVPLAVLEVFTRTVYPISSTRYYFCLSGIACIFLAAALAELMSKKLTYAALIALIAANSVKSNFDLYEEIKLSGIPQMKKMIEETNGGENIAFLHLHEFTVGIMSYYYPNAKHYVCDDTFTVLTDYSVFPNVIEIGNSDNIWKYTDKVYFFNGENYDAKIVSGEEEFSNMPSKPDFRLLGVYNSPYTYFDFDLEIAEKK